MKSKTKNTRVTDRYGMIEALEPRIAPAALTNTLPSNVVLRSATAGGALLLQAGQVLTSGGSYLLYVEAGQVLVHVTDLAQDNQVDYNDITGLSVGNGARFTSFVDIHGDIVTDLNPDGTLSDGGKGDILLDNNIAEIDLRSLTTADFPNATGGTATTDVMNALAMSSYSIFGNIYAGKGLGVSGDPTSGLHISTAGNSLQSALFTGETGTSYYQVTQPTIGSIYAGTAASGQSFSFGASGQGYSVNGAPPVDIHGNLLAFNPSPGEAGASIYNISAGTGQPFNIGTIQAGNGGFNAPGGSIVNVALQGDTAGVNKLIAGNAGEGTTGQPGGSIINFSETASILSEVVLQSGNGGTGLTGAGGNGGNITIGTVSLNAHVQITYGSGGDGYSHGGRGGGQTTGVYTTPEGMITQATDLVSTLHSIGSIGTTQSFDFNGDGYSDAVFSTINPNQVVVALGNSSGGVFGLDSKNYIFLNSPEQVDSIVVGNFTGAINPVTHQPEEDIAVASGVGSFAGVEVYLSEYNAKTGAFEGFSDPLFSPLPAPPENLYTYTPVPITQLVAGDFQGNGVLGLAVLTEQTLAGTTTDQDSVLMYLNGETDAAHPGGTGYFYMTPGNYKDLGSIGAFSPTASLLEVTAATQYIPTTPGSLTSNGHDIIIAAAYGANGFNVLDDSSGHVASTGFGFGQVLIPGATAPTNFDVGHLAVVQDQTNTAQADLVAVSENPVGFLVTFAGNGTGGFTLKSGAGVGINFAYGSSQRDVAIVAIPTTATAGGAVTYSNVAILDYDSAGGDAIDIMSVSSNLKTITTSATLATVSPVTQDLADIAFDTYSPHPVLSGAIPGSGLAQYGFLTGDPDQAYGDDQSIAINQPIATSSKTGVTTGSGYYVEVDFKTAGWYFQAGNGGNSASGPGGDGGSFGQSLSLTTSAGAVTTGTGTLSIVFPADPTYGGIARFIAGSGGNGFGNGGAGGSLTGISVTYADAPELTGRAVLSSGNGGESLTGTGGAGGSMSQLYIITGEYFVAGDGGVGVIGGAGGSLLGNPTSGLISGGTNNIDPYILLQAGNGATGIIGGGAGGGITNFVNEFDAVLGGVTGLLGYYGGNGGDAVAGVAGTGGSIVNSSPYFLNNNLVGDISLQGGAGGSGLNGGAGGSVSNFLQAPTIKEVSTSATVIGGPGGNATLGTGGAGGSLTNISVTSEGVGSLYTYNVTDPSSIASVLDSITSITPISYNRMVSGAGGNSAGGTGGAGGLVYAINTTTVSANSQNVLVAGAGGSGLAAGGNGGSVISTDVDAGSSNGGGKVVVIAGAGGDSYGAQPAIANNAQDVAMAVGGVNGPGGNGGSILRFAQTVNTNTDVDLIAGNGGDTVNHSVAAGNATVDNSGVGGSISLSGSSTEPGITGSIGNSNAYVAIKSYNDIEAGESMQDFVNSYILGDPSAPMNDSVGNVGLVVGAAGLVAGGEISSNGTNGSADNIYAASIMSMVAGSVDNVALIHNLTNYGITTSTGVLGANKTAYYNPLTGQTTDEGVLGQLNYINSEDALVMTPLPGGGELIDGAFVAQNIRTILSARDFQGTQAE